MRIERLKLTNFRNYTDLEIEFGPSINIFIGNNGQGKTNILESIYMLSLSKSNRSGIEDNLIKYNEEVAKIEGLIVSDDYPKKQEIRLTKNKKQLFINGKEIRKNSDYVSNFCVISFTPDDLEIIKGSPNIRRNTINIDISQLNNKYIGYLNEYNQVIKMRNEYLKRMNLNGNSDPRYLDILNQKIIDNSLIIYKYRFSFFEKINLFLPKIYKRIAGLDGLKVVYNTSIHIDTYNEEEIKKRFISKFKKNLNVELMQGMTLIGPHRDDFSFILNEKDMKQFSSQGQQRLAIIAFKIAEIYLFKEKLLEYPVLLLDDIFSEIDASKRNKILKFLQGDIQTIITTTDINDIDSKYQLDVKVFDVKNGKVTKKGRIKNERRKNNNKL